MPSSADVVQHQYDRWAPLYDWLWNRYTRRTTDALQRRVTTHSETCILDVGCGTGAFLERLLAENVLFTEYVGVDLSPEMIARAQAKFENEPRTHFRQADAASLPFEDDTFDRVVSASAFHYFPEPEAALREMHRVARADAEIVILDWCRDFWTIRVLDAVLQRSDPAHHRSYSLEEMQSLLAGASLSVQRAARLRLGWFWGIMLIAAQPVTRS